MVDVGNSSCMRFGCTKKIGESWLYAVGCSRPSCDCGGMPDFTTEFERFGCRKNMGGSWPYAEGREFLALWEMWRFLAPCTVPTETRRVQENNMAFSHKYSLLCFLVISKDLTVVLMKSH
jgi:hypothetical protein